MAWLRGQPGQPQRICDALEGIEKSLTYDDGNPLEDRFLVSFDLNGGKPLAAVSIGNLDTAGNVTFAVPGMGTTVASGGITTWTEAAQNLYRKQAQIISGGHVVVSWLGYEAPGMLPGSMEVFGKERAVDGGARLAAALDGFQITRQSSGGAAPAVHVVAHSYGTTASVYALTKTQWQVASVTFMGSAGIDANVARSASELNVARSASGAPEVYATSSMMDWVAPAGVAGSQINGFIGGIGDLLTDSAGAEARFMDTLINQRPVEARVYPTDWISWPGAKQFSSAGGIDPLTRERLEPVYGHQVTGDGAWSPVRAPWGNGYLDPRTESLRNIALASVGRGQDVTTQTDHDPVNGKQIRKYLP